MTVKMIGPTHMRPDTLRALHTRSSRANHSDSLSCQLFSIQAIRPLTTVVQISLEVFTARYVWPIESRSEAL